jgi:hypothetical protein
MQVYYISGSNNYTIRTEQLANTSSLSIHLQDMYLLTNTSQSLSASAWDSYESMLTFPLTIPSASVGSEYRAYIKSGSCSVWHGSISVMKAQVSESKSNYENQNDGYISNLSDNEYIIMD